MEAPAEHLQPSELGTKEYWDDAYTREIANHATSAEDEGTIWFSDADAESRVIGWLEMAADGELDICHTIRRNDADTPATTFLDLGTGNGHMLFELRSEGWEGRMVGVDYSEKSVDLCRRILQTRQPREEFDNFVFEEYDLLDASQARPDWLPEEGFDVTLDKGTFDAISLSSAVDANGKRVSESYAERVAPLIRQGGLLIITSCNWTEDEVRHWFERPDGRLKYMDRIKYPSFTFGGKSGSKVCSLIFTKL